MLLEAVIVVFDLDPAFLSQFYLRNHMGAQHVNAKANETWYLFGDTLNQDWMVLQRQYVLPLDAAGDDPAPAVGIGGRFSGVR